MVSGKYKNIMKNIMKKLVMIIMAVALIVLPTMAQDWQSTSTMQGTGSSYTPQVTAVGAVSATEMATTTESYSPGRRRAYDANGNWVPDSDDFGGGAETGESNQFPIGDAVLPMMLMSLAFVGVIYFRKRHARA